MKFQDSSFNGLKVTVGTESVTHARTLQKQNGGIINNYHQIYILFCMCECVDSVGLK